MEPASTLTIAVLAVATILPPNQFYKPHITVILKNWVNKNAFPINIYSIANNDYDLKSPTGQKPIAQIMPGHACDINTLIDLKYLYNNAIQWSLLRFRAQRDDPVCCVDLRIDYCQHSSFAHQPVPYCAVTLCRRFPGLPSNWVNLFRKTFDCRGVDEKECLAFEIDGKILGHDMRHSCLSAQKIVKTKIE